MLCFQPINVDLCPPPFFLGRNWKISIDYIVSSIKGFKFETLLKTRVLLHKWTWITGHGLHFQMWTIVGVKCPIFKFCLFPLKTLSGISFSPLDILKGTKKLECTLPDGSGRRVIQNHLNYPFSIVSYADHFYHTDWRRWAPLWRAEHAVLPVSNSSWEVLLSCLSFGRHLFFKSSFHIILKFTSVACRQHISWRYLVIYYLKRSIYLNLFLENEYL